MCNLFVCAHKHPATSTTPSPLFMGWTPHSKLFSICLFCVILLLLLCFGVCWGGVLCRRDPYYLYFYHETVFFCGIFLWGVVFINCKVGQLINAYHPISFYPLFSHLFYPPYSLALQKLSYSRFGYQTMTSHGLFRKYKTASRVFWW